MGGNVVYGAFAKCNISEVEFLGRLERLGNNTFNVISKSDGAIHTLRKVTFKNGVNAIGEGVFENQSVLAEVDLGPSSGTVIEDSAFRDNTSLDNIDFTKISAIGDAAFAATGLSEVRLGSHVTNIGRNAFEYTTLRVVEYNPSINIIPQGCFSRAKIGAITVGSHVNTVDREAFSNATLPNIDMLPQNTLIKTRAFYYSKLQNLNMTDKYRYENNVFDNATIGTANVTTTNIPTQSFYKARIGTLNLENTVSIGEFAFAASIVDNPYVLPATVSDIGRYAFGHASGLKKVHITDTVTRVDKGAFAGNTLESVHIEHMPTQFGTAVFSREADSPLTHSDRRDCIIGTVILDDSITNIPDSTFQSAQVQSTFKTSANIGSIGNNAFEGARLENVEMNEFFGGMPKLERVGDSAFKSTRFRGYSQTEVRRVLALPPTLTHIGTMAFASGAQYNSGEGMTLYGVELGENIESIGVAAFGGHRITDFSKLPDYIKANPTKYPKIFGDKANPYYVSRFLTTMYQGKVFPLEIKDHNGNVPVGTQIDGLVPHETGLFSVKPGYSNNTTYIVYPHGDILVHLYQNPWQPSWKSPLNIINGLNDEPDRWVTNLPSGTTITILDGLNLRTPGAQRPKLKFSFRDGSYSIFDTSVTVAASMSDAWIPVVSTLNTNKGVSVDVASAITNKPSNATLIHTDRLDVNKIGMQQINLRYEFPDKTIKTVVVNVNVIAREADKWLPQTKVATIKHKNTQEEFDLWSLVTNVPESGVTKSVIRPVFYNFAKGTYTGIVRVLFNLDQSIKDVNLRVTVLDDATAYVVRVKKLTVAKNRSINLVDGITEYPQGTGFDVVRDIDTSVIGPTTGTIRATFPDLTTAEYDIEVEVIDPSTEAAQFVPKTKVLKAYVKEPVDLTTGLKNLPTTATVSTKTNVSTTEVGRKTGIITITFADTSRLDVDIYVDVFNRDFFEVEDETDIPSGYSKITFTEGTGVRFENDDIRTKLYAAKNGQPILAKFFPRMVLQLGYIGDISWTPLVNTVITSETNFEASANPDTRTKAEKFVPETRVLLLYQGDLATSLTECLVNKPVDMQELKIKVEANRTKLGLNDGLLELIFDDTSKLDIPVKVQVVGRVNSLADRFTPITEDLEVEVGGNIDIKTGLKNDVTEYDNIRILNDVTTTIAGRVIGQLEVTFSDDSIKIVDIRVFVRAKGHTAPTPTEADNFTPSTRQLEVALGGNIDIKTGLLNAESEYTRVEVIRNVTTTTAGIVTGTIRVHFADNSTKDVEISVLVKGIAQDITLASKYVLTTQVLEAKAGESVDLKAGITSGTTDITIIILEDIDTTFAGQKAGRLQLRFTDGSILETAIKVNVTGKTSIDINNNNGGGGNTNNNSNTDNSILNNIANSYNDLKEYVKNLQEIMEKNNNSTTIIQAPKEEDKLGKPIVRNTFEIKSYIQMPYDNRFNPDARVTRADFVVMFAAAKDLRGAKPVKFSDIQSGEPYFKALQACVSNGIINGYADGTFRPHNPLTRAEFAKIIGSLGAPSKGESQFSDIVPQHWAKRFIDNAFINGYLDGYPDGTFRPNAYITRAEAVKVLNRYAKKLVLSADLLQTDGIKRFVDVSTKHWAFDEITSAANNIKIEEFIWSKDKTKKLFYRLKESK